MRRVILTCVLALTVLAPAAQAEERFFAVPSNQYGSNTVTIDQGETLLFRNLDLQQHDIVSVAQAGGKPIFSTPLLGPGEEALVQGAQQLKGGSYPFFCSVHPFMKATLVVTGAGAPSPPPQGDTQPPGVSLRIVDTKLSRVKKDRRLRVQVTTNESGNVQLAATIRSGKKTVTIARSTKGFASPGRATVAMALTKAGRSALRSKRSAKIAAEAHATDGAGNTGHGTTSRTLKK